jgi:hypothetical protein
MRRISLSLAGFMTLSGLIAPPVQSGVLATAISQTQAQPEAKTFTGTILKSGESFVLSDSVPNLDICSTIRTSYARTKGRK